jgi:hypothetical protein
MAAGRPRQGQGGLHVDSPDARMGLRAAHKGGMEAVWGSNIVCIATKAAKKSPILPPWYELPEAHRR